MQGNKRRGFTLIELLVVIAIIAILAAILFPIFTSVRKNAQGSACMSNLKQIGLAFKDYMANYDGRFMPAEGIIGKSFPLLLRPYVKNDQIFLCPAASKRPQDYWDWSRISPTETDPNAKDIGWKIADGGTWNDGTTGGWSRSTYGNNLSLGGMDAARMNNNVNNPWCPKHIATEAMVAEPTKIIYMTDSRWVDLYGGWHQGRIGMARERHPGGANSVCVDGHCKWLPINYMNKWPMPRDANPRWDYRLPGDNTSYTD